MQGWFRYPEACLDSIKLFLLSSRLISPSEISNDVRSNTMYDQIFAVRTFIVKINGIGSLGEPLGYSFVRGMLGRG